MWAIHQRSLEASLFFFLASRRWRRSIITAYLSFSSPFYRPTTRLLNTCCLYNCLAPSCLVEIISTHTPEDRFSSRSPVNTKRRRRASSLCIMTSDIFKLTIVLPQQHKAKLPRRRDQKDVLKRIKLWCPLSGYSFVLLLASSLYLLKLLWKIKPLSRLWEGSLLNCGNYDIQEVVDFSSDRWLVFNELRLNLLFFKTFCTSRHPKGCKIFIFSSATSTCLSKNLLNLSKRWHLKNLGNSWEIFLENIFSSQLLVFPELNHAKTESWNLKLHSISARSVSSRAACSSLLWTFY